MTVIAWDGKMMAGDRLIHRNGLIEEGTKVFETMDYIIGLSGQCDLFDRILSWVRSGLDDNFFPVIEKNSIEFIIYDKTEMKLYSYESSKNPSTIESRFYSIGHGREYASAIMHIGKTAKEAVEVANSLDVYCGMGVDVIYVDAKG